MIEDEDIIPMKLPDFSIEGSWNMVQLFHGFPQLSGRLIYFDLDTIIVDNIDHILCYNGDFAVLEDFGSKRPMFGGALMMWEQQEFTWIWEKFENSVSKDVKNKKRADVWYGEQILQRHEVDWLQDLHRNEIHSYKINLKSGDLLPTTKIVCFHGVPMPHEVSNKWCMEHWR